MREHVGRIRGALIQLLLAPVHASQRSVQVDVPPVLGAIAIGMHHQRRKTPLHQGLPRQGPNLRQRLAQVKHRHFLVKGNIRPQGARPSRKSYGSTLLPHSQADPEIHFSSTAPATSTSHRPLLGAGSITHCAGNTGSSLGVPVEKLAQGATRPIHLTAGAGLGGQGNRSAVDRGPNRRALLSNAVRVARKQKGEARSNLCDEVTPEPAGRIDHVVAHQIGRSESVLGLAQQAVMYHGSREGGKDHNGRRAPAKGSRLPDEVLLKKWASMTTHTRERVRYTCLDRWAALLRPGRSVHPFTEQREGVPAGKKPGRKKMFSAGDTETMQCRRLKEG